MNKQKEVGIKNSITTQLLKVVFGIYFLIAVTVTIIHMSAEYFNTKEHVLQDLLVFQKTFEQALAVSMWNLDDQQMHSTVTGMLKVPIIIGAKIQDNAEEILSVAGVILDNKGNSFKYDEEGTRTSYDMKGIFSKIFVHQFPIYYQEGEDETGSLPPPRQVGTGFLYSSDQIVFQKVQYGFLFILINSVIKTVALWVIFLLIARTMLKRPLSILNDAANQLNLDNLDNLTINVQTKGRNELKNLEEAFNGMIHKLLHARGDLQSYAKKLEVRQEELQNTRNYLKNIINFMPSILIGIDDKERVTQWNLKAEQATGIHAETAENQSLQSAYPDLEPHLDKVRLSMKECRPQKLTKVTSKNQDKTVYSDITIYPLDQQGPQGAVIRIDDVTEQVELAESMMQTERKTARMEGELNAASEIQKFLLPQSPPDLDQFEIASIFYPAREVSGDYFDFIKIDDRHTALVIADVSGKGVSAAMSANTARVVLKAQAVTHIQPVKVLSALNRSLHREFQTKQFLTLGYLLLDTQTATLSYASAGHEPFILITKTSEEYRLLKPKGYPFSSLHAELFDERILQESYSLEQGDMIFCYTDGATDVINEQGEMFGEQRLYSLVQRLRTLSAKQILENIYQALQTFQGHAEQTDDITMFILKRL